MGTVVRLRGVFQKDRREHVDKDVRVRFGDNQRRAKLDDIVMRAVRSRQDAAFAEAIHYVLGLAPRGRV